MGLFGDNTDDRDYRHNQEMRSLERRKRIENVGNVMSDPLNRGKPLILNDGWSVISGLVTHVIKANSTINDKPGTRIYYLSDENNSCHWVSEEDEEYSSIINKWQEACK